MKNLTLTFDNGPKHGDTERILDILKARGLKTTFFLVGQQLYDPKNREAAARAKVEGHWFGNHSTRHLIPFGWSEDPDHVAKEIVETEELMGDLVHEPDHFIRPPGKAMLGPHLLSKPALDYVLAHKMTMVTWNVIPRDGEEPRDEWVDRAFALMAKEEWPVLVIHDHHLGHAMYNLERFLDRAAAEDYRVVQEFPDSVLPIVRGEIRQPVETFATLS